MTNIECRWHVGKMPWPTKVIRYVRDQITMPPVTFGCNSVLNCCGETFFMRESACFKCGAISHWGCVCADIDKTMSQVDDIRASQAAVEHVKKVVMQSTCPQVAVGVVDYLTNTHFYTYKTPLMSSGQYTVIRGIELPLLHLYHKNLHFYGEIIMREGRIVVHNDKHGDQFVFERDNSQIRRCRMIADADKIRI